LVIQKKKKKRGNRLESDESPSVSGYSQGFKKRSRGGPPDQGRLKHQLTRASAKFSKNKYLTRETKNEPQTCRKKVDQEFLMGGAWPKKRGATKGYVITQVPKKI